MEAAETITDVVHDNMEVYLRARGWLMTMAMLSIRKPVWFNLQTAIFAADKIMSLCLTTTNGVYPTTDHLSAAWASTVHFWSEQVRITNQSLDGFVKNTGTWEHKWASPPANSSGGHSDATTSLPTEIAAELLRLQKVAREHQSMVDKHKAAGRWEQKGAKGDNKSGKGKGGTQHGKGDHHRERPPQRSPRRDHDRRR